MVKAKCRSMQPGILLSQSVAVGCSMLGAGDGSDCLTLQTHALDMDQRGYSIVALQIRATLRPPAAPR